MNKKFSTLVASLLLASAVGTATAAGPNFVRSAQPETAGDFKAGTYYQLTTDEFGQEVLVMEKTANGYILQSAPYAKATLANSLWVIEPSTNTDDEGGLSFRFKNKRYGIYISFNAKDATIAFGSNAGTPVASLMPGNTAVWKWAEALEGKKFSYDGADLKATFGAQKDSVVYLNKLQADVNGISTVAAMKTATHDSYSALRIYPKTAGWVLLGTDDLNSMLGMQDYTTGKLKMNFNPETTGENLFTKNAYRAVAAAGTNSYRTGALADANKAVEYWATEIKEYEAAFNKVGTLAEYNKRVAEIKALEKNLTPAGTQNKWLAKIAVLEGEGEGSIAAQKKAVNDAIENYDGTNEELKDALKVLNKALLAVDAADLAKTVNLKLSVKLGKAHSALLQNNIDDAQTALDALNVEFEGCLDGFASAKGEYEASLTELNTAINALAAVLTAEDKVTADALNTKLTTYSANAAYVNKVNSLIDRVNEGAMSYTGIVLNNGWNTEVAGMTISKVSPSTYSFMGATTRYMTTDAFKNYMAAFASTQGTLEIEINAAITNLLKNYQEEKAGVLKAHTDFGTAWGAFAGKVRTMEAAGSNFADLTDNIDAVQTALSQNAKKLDLIVKLEAASNELIPTLDKAYVDKVKERNSAYAAVKASIKESDKDVDGIISAYDSEIALYEELVGLKDQVGASNVASAKFLQANLDFGYFRYIKIDWDWANMMSSAWNNEVAYWKSVVSQWVSLQYTEKKYLMVDTAYMTQYAGDQYQSFTCGKEFKEIKGASDAARDINGRINFMFAYSPSNDSLLIESEGGALKKTTTQNWVDMTAAEVAQGQFGNLVMVKVLNATREVTIQQYEIEKGVHNIPTINTRIGFASVATQLVKQIPTGVYLVKNASQVPAMKGKYAVDNFLASTYGYGWTAEKNQNFQHIPAAQWVVVANEKSTTNSIYNRESERTLKSTRYAEIENVQFYTDADNNLFTIYGDTLEFVPVTDVTTPELGYLALEDLTGKVDADYTTYAFNLIKGLSNGVSIAADKQGNLKVSADPTYFTVTPVSTLDYGYAMDGVAAQLKCVVYTISLDGKYVSVNRDGRYVLSATPNEFLMKEFKQDENGVCHYALINRNNISKVGVDYTSTLLTDESLEDATVDWANENTATFALAKKEIPQYRTMATEPSFQQFFQADNEESIILSENPENKGAGTTANPSKPTGLNYLGQGADDFSIYVDTAYVRNETKRPQYLLGLRPDFTPLEIPCPDDDPAHTHPMTKVPQTKAEYLVVLNDSIAKNPTKKSMYVSKENFTRLAFVPATHRNDSLIMSDGNRIDLSKNVYNNVTFQFMYAEPETDSKDFYIKAGQNAWVKILNAVPVIVDKKEQADVFNVVKKDTPTSNEGVEVSSIKVIAKEGAVDVIGAAGKRVVISNVLGQVIANTVITSDNATISAPAGVVVVAVEGEAAEKAIVK